MRIKCLHLIVLPGEGIFMPINRMRKRLTKIFYKIDKGGFVTYDLNHNIPTKLMGNKTKKKIIKIIC